MFVRDVPGGCKGKRVESSFQLVDYDVAIEINARYRIPSEAFIKLAKKSGAKFAFGTNNTGRELGNLQYCRRMIKKCGLTKEDMFVPRPHDQKPIFKKGLPKE